MPPPFARTPSLQPKPPGLQGAGNPGRPFDRWVGRVFFHLI